MRVTSSVIILTVILTGCSSISSNLRLSTEQSRSASQSEDRSLDVIRNQLTEKRFKELDTILASDIESRNLVRAKILVLELNSTITGDHERQKELSIAEQWINESLGYREKIKLLEKQTRRLRGQIAKQNEALKKVRRILVSE